MRIADYIQALPDAYAKHSESNNYKLLSLEQMLVAALREDIEAVQSTLDIRTVTGKTLDLYGSIYGQARGSMKDEQYRVVILQKAMQNLVGGDYDSVIKALASVFDVPATEFKIKESKTDCSVSVEALPYSALQTAGITAKQAWQLIKSMLPAGVALAAMNLDGTFEFAMYADEYDESAGFGDTDQTIGGYLGLLETNDIDVPV